MAWADEREGVLSVRWVLPEASEEASAQLASELSLHPLAARVLVSRGHRTPAAAAAFLSDRLADLPNPLLMKGMPEAVDQVCAAVRARKKITLYGDYDVDGVCSTALTSLFLDELGANVATYIPHRLEEGYGLNGAAIDRIASDGTALLVTLDCGITSHAEVARANALGLRVVVVDHHAVPETMPPAAAVLNPMQPGCGYPTRHLCAGGVAFNLCMGVRSRLRSEGFFQGRTEPNLKSLLDLVALATICDVVPLTGANRVLVRHGLAELTAARRIGVRALKEVAGLTASSPVSAGQVGFRLGPRINAAGRLDDASLGLQLLRSRDGEQATKLARRLDDANRERQGIEQQILEGAIAQASARPQVRGLVLHADGWHPGVIGIVASRVVERFHRPTVMIAMKDGVGRGSARSIEGFHLFEALQQCGGLLAKFGGHKHAAGLTVERARLAEFVDAFERVAASKLSEEDLLPRCRIDAWAGLNELSEPAVEALQAIGPFGAGNPEPVLATRRLDARAKTLVSKREGQPGHLKLHFETAPRLDAIGFGMAERLTLTEGPLDLAYQVGIDEWNGNRRVQLKLKDVRVAA